MSALDPINHISKTTQFDGTMSHQLFSTQGLVNRVGLRTSGLVVGNTVALDVAGNIHNLNVASSLRSDIHHDAYLNRVKMRVQNVKDVKERNEAHVRISHLGKLMLAKETTSVSASGSCLRTETRRQSHQGQWQLYTDTRRKISQARYRRHAASTFRYRSTVCPHHTLLSLSAHDITMSCECIV